MPAYNFAAHEELSPYLEKYPSLFGFYSDGLHSEDWIKDTGMISQPYRHANAFFPTRLYETPPSSPSTAQTLSTTPELQTFYFSDSDSDSDHDIDRLEQHPSGKLERGERGWLYRKYSPSHAETRRSNAEHVGKNRVSETGRSGIHLTKTKNLSPQGGHDFSQLDGLLVNLASLLQSCLVHVSSPGRSLPNSPNPLPERLSHPLASFHDHLGLEDSVILPRKSSVCQRWYSPSYPYEIKQHTTTARAPRFDGRRFPSPLGSHPPGREQDLAARKFRALQLLCKTTRVKRHFLPSLIALLVARSLVLVLLAVLSRRRSEKLPSFSSYYTSSRVIRPYGVPSKASEFLGLSYIRLRTGSARPSPRSIYSNQGQEQHGVRQSGRLSWSSNLSVKEMVQLEEPKSKWSPWSRASSSSLSGSSRKSDSPELRKGPSSRSSCTTVEYGVDEFESRIIKLRELEKITEKLLRTVGWWIWGDCIPSTVGGTESGCFVVDAQVENCYKLLIQEGFLRHV